MKSMREMMTLMEGVMAIPGLNEDGPRRHEVPAYLRKEKGEKPLTPKDVQDQEKEGKLSDRENLKKSAQNLEEKSSSEKQARFMAACAHGADYDSCPSDKVSKEFNQADKGTKQLSSAMKHVEEAHVDSCRQSNPKNAREACKMEENLYDAGFEESGDYTDWAMNQGEMGSAAQGLDPTAGNENVTRGLEMYRNYTDSFVEPQEALDLVLRNFDEEGLDASEIDEISDAIKAQYSDEFDDDYTDWSMRQGEMGLEEETVESEEESVEDELEEDLQNGYHDVHVASGNDYFPNGADGPVVKAVGPSGARHGDNPEQKKMKTELEEVHKELVYGYRSFLEEAASDRMLNPQPLPPKDKKDSRRGAKKFKKTKKKS